MAFRDNQAAALARADALQRERDRLELELDGANDELADLKEELETKARELAKLPAGLQY
jgi:predicted  nucleic acid-binding Zn-ribbon protein